METMLNSQFLTLIPTTMVVTMRRCFLMIPFFKKRLVLDGLQYGLYFTKTITRIFWLCFYLNFSHIHTKLYGDKKGLKLCIIDDLSV